MAETELQTALARLAIIKEMKEENRQQEIPSTTEKAPNSQKTNSPLLSKEQPAPTPKTPIPPSGNGQS